MRICAHNGIVVKKTILLHDDSCEVLQVDLMDNTGAWWNDLEVVESLRAPFQELESLPISIEFNDLILLSCIWSSKNISLYRVINDQINWAKWIDLSWVTAKSLHSVSHRCEIDDSWHSCEILQDNSSRLEWNIDILLRVLNPVEDSLNVRSQDVVLVAVADSRLKKDSNGVRQLAQSLITECWQFVESVVAELRLDLVKWVWLW